MKTALVVRAMGCVATLLIGGVAAAGPGDRIQRHPPVVCTDCRSEDLYPAVDADAAGNSLIVWVKYEFDFAESGVWGRWFGPDGRPRGEQFRVSPQLASFDGSPDTPSVAMRPDGGFVVTWLAQGFFTPDRVRMRLFDSVGAPQGGAITVSGPGHEPVHDQSFPPKVAMADDGDFVVVWASVNRTTTNWTVFARRYGPTGAPKGAEFSVDPNGPSPRVRFPDVAMDAAGRFVVAWLQSDGGGSGAGNKVLARRYSATAVAQGAPFPVSTAFGTGFPISNAAVAMAADGRFTVVFQRIINDASGNSRSVGIFGRRFDTAGAPLGGEFRASAAGRSDFRGEVDVDMDPDGDFVVAWIGQEPDFGQTNLHTRLYAASGMPLTPDRSYGFGHVGPRDEKVAMDGTGNFVATWMNYSEDPNGTGFGPNIFAQHFAGPDDTRAGCAGFIPNIVGTLANDSRQGSAADDVIHGLGGNDLLKGGGGADIICGGAGDDQLFGEQGTDHLLGGPGDDVLDGGSDSDICNGNGQTADTALACETVLQVP